MAWIETHCRRAWSENTGFRPELYREWQILRKDLSSDESAITSSDENDDSGQTSGYVQII